MGYIEFLSEHGATLLLGTVTTLKVLVCSIILYVVISITWLSVQCFGTALLIYYFISRFLLVPFLRWLEVLAAKKVGKRGV